MTRHAAPARDPAARAGLAVLAYAALVVLTWGSNYPLMKLAFQDIGPLTFSAARLLGGAVTVALWIVAQRRHGLLPQGGEGWRLGGIGLLQLAAVLGFSGIALQVLPAGRTATAVYSMPLWAALFGMALRRERLAPRRLLGVAVSLAGLSLFMDPSVIAWHDPGSQQGMVMVLCAAALWGLGAVLYGMHAWRTPLLAQTLWQLLAAGLLMSCLAFWLEAGRPVRWSPTLVAVLAWNFVGPTALAVWAWSQVLRRVPAAVAGQLLMSTPLVGILCSVLIFGEDLPGAFLLSAFFVTLGGLLVLLPERRGR
ncbi:DMT family transporter [Orrella sp. JC864]|uniref:DMT family transporter n=1 Tax=Orrella sp. JC864 TaxID=3120298 RepID=UPI003009CB37